MSPTTRARKCLVISTWRHEMQSKHHCCLTLSEKVLSKQSSDLPGRGLGHPKVSRGPQVC